MFPVLALATLAGILITAGWRNQNVIDVLLGRDTQNPKGRVPQFTLPDSGAGTGGDFGAPGTAPTTGGDFVNTDGPLARIGRLIGFPHVGTHTLGNWQSDNAVDIAVPVGTPMVAMESGTVLKVTKHPQGAGRFAGDQITIQGSDNSFFYAHGVASVHAGQKVTKGQQIGTSGSANGVAHLHLGILHGDPRNLLSRWLRGH